MMKVAFIIIIVIVLTADWLLSLVFREESLSPWQHDHLYITYKG